MNIKTIVCQDCNIEIKGDHMMEKGKPIHIRCLKKRIESKPNFGGWVKVKKNGN